MVSKYKDEFKAMRGLFYVMNKTFEEIIHLDRLIIYTIPWANVLAEMYYEKNNNAV